MKNLKINFSTIINLSAKNEKELPVDKSNICIDALNRITYYTIGNRKLGSIDKNMNMLEVISIPLTEIGINDDEQIFSLDFLPDCQCLCLIYENGFILAFDSNRKFTDDISTYELNKRIRGCAWSPDYQLLILATETSLFMLSKMTNLYDNKQDFKIIKETSLRPITLGKDQLVTIGWGSKETQFQGSLGKNNREKQNPDKIPIEIREEFDDRRVLISWRADGQFFTVSSVDDVAISSHTNSPIKNVPNKLPCRQIRVWNRDFEYMSQCQFVSGIEAALNMRPSGNLIAVSRVSNYGRYIWFFERNGEYRNKFQLPTSDTTYEDLVSDTVVRFLSWNIDSTILAIFIYNKKAESNELQFWTVSNYSWTEKLRLEVDELVQCFWDNEFSLKFHYITKNFKYHQIVMQSEYNCDNMLACSLNGDKMRVTDFQLAMIPPPMCHMELQFTFAGTPSAFAQHNEYGLAVIGSNFQRISIYNLLERKFIHRKNFTLPQNFQMLYNLEWKDENTLIALRQSQQDKSTELVEIRIDTEEIHVVHTSRMQPRVAFVIKSLIHWAYDIDDDAYPLEYEFVPSTTNERCLLLGSTTNFTTDQNYEFRKIENGQQSILFTLTNTFLLFVNNKRLHSSVISFCCTNEFLLLQTLENKLYCITMKSINRFLKNEFSDEKFSTLFTHGRSIERGTQLIGAEPNGTRVWLQMKRGNLELIHPRDIVIENLKNLLDVKLWRKAFLEMRRHRVDLNLIYDHNPKAFIDDVEQFVNQIDDVDFFNVFLTSLKASDITNHMFSVYYLEGKDNTKINPIGFESKLNNICEKIRNVLMNLPDQKRQIHLYPVVLTTFIIEGKISAALINLHNFQTKLNGQCTSQMVQRWLRHIGYLVKEDHLFKQALKTYNLDIAVMVAQSTNMDPKEYLPILDGLKQKSPMTYQQYHIDLYMEDWQSALERIAQLIQECPEDESFLKECISLITQHNLYSFALKVFCCKPHYKEICKIVACHLKSQGQISEAAVLFEKGEDIISAINCLVAVQDFHGYIRLAGKSNISAEIIENTLEKMVLSLLQKDNFHSAADILMHLGKEKNAERIFDCYSNAFSWKKLVQFVNEQGQDNELIINRARVTLSTRSTQIIERIDEWKDTLNKYHRRLVLLRQEKLQKIALIVTTHSENSQFIDAETSSQASSNYSLNSQRTHLSTASSRRRKHKERKKEQIKEGSHWEDAAILLASQGIYKSINDQQEEMIELLPALLSMDLVEKGRRLQKEMLELLSFASDLLEKIWPEYLEPKLLPGPFAEHYRNAKGEVMWPNTEDAMPTHFHIEPELIRPKFNNTSNEWTLKIFK